MIGYSSDAGEIANDLAHVGRIWAGAMPPGTSEPGRRGRLDAAAFSTLVVLDGGGAPLRLGSSEAMRRKQARGRGLDPSWIGCRLAAGEIERGGWLRWEMQLDGWINQKQWGLAGIENKESGGG